MVKAIHSLPYLPSRELVSEASADARCRHSPVDYTTDTGRHFAFAATTTQEPFPPPPPPPPPPPAPARLYAHLTCSSVCCSLSTTLRPRPVCVPPRRPRSICIPTYFLGPHHPRPNRIPASHGRSRNLHAHVEDHQVRHKHHRVELQWLPLGASSVHLRMREMQGAILPSLHIQAPGLSRYVERPPSHGTPVSRTWPVSQARNASAILRLSPLPIPARRLDGGGKLDDGFSMTVVVV
ncbi:hypothetical protein PMIN05_005247 [Paraphaeosphaeria minitans]